MTIATDTGSMQTRARRNGGLGIWYLVVLLAAGVLYVLSAAPGTLWQDNGMAQVRVLEHDYVGKLGLALAHPLYYLAAQAFQFLPFHESAYKTNLVSAVFAALTVANVFLLLNWVLVIGHYRRWAALVGTLALALAHTFWQHAALAEVYSVSTFVLTCELLALARFCASGRVGWWLLACFLNGLECSNHVLALVTLAAIGIWSFFLFRDGTIKVAWLVPGVALWVLGCLPYEYLGYQAWTAGQSVPAVLHSMLFGQFQSAVLNTHLSVRLLVMTVGVIVLNLPTLNIVLIPAGWFAGREFIGGRIFNFLLLATIFHFAFAMRYAVADQYTFFIIPILLLCLWLGIGAAWFLDPRSPRWVVLLILFALTPPAVYALIPRFPGVVHRIFPDFGKAPIPYRDEIRFFFHPWKTGYHGADRLAKEVFQMAGPNAIVIADSTSSRPFGYYQLARKERTDLQIVPGLYDDLPVDQRVKKLTEELRRRQIWVVRPYLQYTPDWILKHFRLVPQGPIYRVQALEEKTTRMGKTTTKQTTTRGQDSLLKWRPANGEPFTVNGLPWFQESGRTFVRLPKRAEKLVTPGVWGNAQTSSGARVRFKTDSISLSLRIHHGGGSLDMPHFCAVGCSGIDLYEGPPDAMTFWTANRPGDLGNPYICAYFNNLPRTMREFTLYLPTYANLSSLEIGLDPKARIAPPSAFALKQPIAFYGTSITHGGCASRSGNGYVPLIGRMLGLDVVNMGFSGSGRCEPEMADFLGEIDAAAYVFDPLPNMSPDLMKERYDAFVARFRTHRPSQPLVLMSKIRYAQDNYAGTEAADAMNKIVLDTYRRCVQRGDKNIYFIDGTKIIGLGGNHPSVDGCHLTDLGFKIVADALAPVLAKILKLPQRP